MTNGSVAQARSFSVQFATQDWAAGSNNGTLYINLQNNGNITVRLHHTLLAFHPV